MLEIMKDCQIVHDEKSELKLIIEFDRAGIMLDSCEYFCDFNDKWHQNLASTIKPSNSALARACGVKAGMNILDATAGFGRDSFTLAMLKANVTAIEQHPLVASLLMYAAKDMQNLSVICNNHINIIGAKTWDVIYFDFMFSKNNRNAKANQGIELLSELSEQKELPEKIWQTALATATKVVIKRPNQKSKIPVAFELPKPNHSIKTKTVSFDVYLGGL